MTKRYAVNEVFYSPQGEGIRTGEMSVFIRFTGCNMRCDVEPGPRSPGGFACDTEFESGRLITVEEMHAWVEREAGDSGCKWLVLTGGEPGLQVDKPLLSYFKEKGYQIAIETNGTVDLYRRLWPEDGQGAMDDCSSMATALAMLYPLDWITVSPKCAEHAIKQTWAHEVKYVRGWGQAVPTSRVRAMHYILSPAFQGNHLDKGVLQWCLGLIQKNPTWRLGIQQHKTWSALLGEAVR